MKTLSPILWLLVLISLMASAQTQEVSIADDRLNAAIWAELQIPGRPLTAQDLVNLTNLDARFRGVTSLEGLGAAHDLTTLNLGNNQLMNLSFPSGLTNLTWLDLADNELTSLTLPPGLPNLKALNLAYNQLTNFFFLSGLTNLTTLDLYANGLTSLTLPAGLTSLTNINLGAQGLRGQIPFPSQLTNFSFLGELANLTTLDLDGNQLTDVSFLTGLPKLVWLNVAGNQLTNFSFLSGLTNLTTLYLDGLTSLILPAGLTNLIWLYLEGNLLTTFVLPEQLALTSLAGTVASLRSQGVSVYTYPLSVSLASPQRRLAGAFRFTLTDPPAAYTILSSSDLAAWNELGTLTNALGAAVFTDAEAKNSSQKFYRARLAP